MSKKRYLSIFAFLLAVLFAFALGFGLSACGKDKDEDDDGDKEPTTPAHTHSYVLDGDEWEWSDDFSMCWNTVTCANEDGLCDKLTDTWYADVTSVTTATCTEAGKTIYTATYGNDTVGTQEVDAPALGHTLQHTDAKDADCGTETDGNIEYWYCGVCGKYFSDAEATENSEITAEDTVVAWAHTYTEDSDGEDAWHWYVSADGQTYTATVDLKCSECEKTQTVDATVSGPDENGNYTGTYTFSEDVVFKDTHTPTGEEEQAPEPEHTYSVQITTTTIEYTVGDTESFGAKVFCDDDEIEDATVTWTSSVETVATIESSTGLFTAVAEGTAIITATYTYGDGLTATDTLTVTVSAAEEPGTSEEAQTFPLELDFTGGSFTAGQVFVNKYTTEGEGDDAVNIAPGDGKVTYSDGNETGFTAMGSADDSKAIEIKTQNNYTTLHFDGSAELTKNSIAYTLKTAGTYYIKMSYFAPSPSTSTPDVSGRYGVVYIEGATGSKEEVGTVADSEKTENNTDIKTRTVEITIEEATTIYIGSKSSGLYFTFIGIYDEDPNGSSSEEHTHTYGDPVWAWEQSEDNTWTCDTVTMTCTGCEDTADGHTITADATVNSQTSGAACTSQTVVYTAKATLNGKEIEDSKTETVAASADHTYTAEFTWTPSDGSFSVSVTFTCSVCGTSYTDASSAQVSGPDESGIYTATITDSYGTEYTDTYDPNDGIYFVSIEDYAHMTAKVGDSFTLTATVKDGHGEVVTPAEGSVTWRTDTSNLITLAAESGDMTCDVAGTAIVYAIYTDSEGSTWESDPYYILISAVKTTPEGDQYDAKIDFSDAEGLEVGSAQMVALDENSTLTYVDIDLEGQIENDVLKTNSFTKYGTTTYTNYILVDFSKFSGYSFELSVTFTGTTTDTTMAVVNALVENAGGSGQSSSIFGDTAPNLGDEIYKATYTEDAATLTYPGTVSSANETVYIVWDRAVLISSISLELWTGERVNKLPSDVYEIYVDLTNGASEEGSQGGSLDEYGFIELVDLTGQTDFKEGYFSTANDSYSTGYTYTFAGGGDDAAALTNYIVINLAGHEYASITLMVGEGSSAGIVAIDSVAEEIKDNESSDTIVASSASSTGLLAWAGEVTEYGDQLFIVYSADIKIYSITLKFDGKAKEDEGSTPDYTIEIDNQNVELYVNGNGAILVAKVTYNGQEIPGATVSWSSENEDVLRVDANGIATAVKADETTTVKVTATYTDPTGQAHTAEITVKVGPDPNEGEEEDGTLTVNIDFTDATNTSLMANLGTDTSTARDVYLDDDNVVKYVVTSSGASYSYGWDTTNGYFATGNSTDAGLTRYVGGDITNYFELNIAGSGATYMELEIELGSRYDYNLSYNSTWIELTDTLHYFTAQTGYGQQSAQALGGTAIKYFSVSDGKITFSWSGDVSGYSTLYLVYTTSINIYSINIKLTGIESSGEEKTMVAATDTVDFTDEATRSAVILTSGETITITDIISLHVGTESSYVSAYEDNYALYMQVVTESNATESTGTYFIIDASGLGGQTITITITWSGKLANGNYAYDTYLAIGTSMSTGVTQVGGDTLAFAHYDLVKSETRTFTITVPRDATELYLYQPGGTNHYAGYIYSVTVEYEKEVEGESGEAGSAEKTKIASFGADLTSKSDSIWQDWVETKDVMSDSTGKLTYTDYGMKSGDSTSPYLMTGTDGGGIRYLPEARRRGTRITLRLTFPSTSLWGTTSK